MITLFDNASRNEFGIAIVSNNKEYSYADLLRQSASIAAKLLGDKPDLNEISIAFLVRPSFEYVATLWGIWRAGGIAVPLAFNVPFEAHEHVLTDADCNILITETDFVSQFGKLTSDHQIELVELAGLLNKAEANLPELSMSRKAMILYTSGTTSKPKGVVTTHEIIDFQSCSLIKAWGCQRSDHVLNVLPLNHVHGIVVILNTSLRIGATCEFIDHFDPAIVFKKFRERRINVFMAVPTIYYKLIQYFDNLDLNEQEAIQNALLSFRLMVSGSAALPVSVLEKWKTISGHILLERYGMTEIGIALSNPYTEERRPGHVGLPLEDVNVRLTDEHNKEIINGSGEIQIRGQNVFKEYWKNPIATSKSFTSDGWFKTGDIAEINNGYFRILGRDSVDIIKTGGHKVSALEIEEVVRTFNEILDCSVVGIPDDEWGEVIGIVLIVKESFDLSVFKLWSRDHFPGFMVPRKHMIIEEFPRNAMGKVTKKKLISLFK